MAGGLIALPERYWRAPGLGRGLLSALGVFFAGMAVLQAWPGRGFWQGRLPGGPGTLTAMIQSMAQTPQPGFLAGWVRGFASFTAAHGFAVNLFAVIALALIGAALLTSAAELSSPAALNLRRRLIRVAVIAAVLLCLADWVLIEDLGFFGGLGTDPNSMIPMALLLVAGYLALAPAPALVAGTDASAGRDGCSAGRNAQRQRWRRRRGKRRRCRWRPEQRSGRPRRPGGAAVFPRDAWPRRSARPTRGR